MSKEDLIKLAEVAGYKLQWPRGITFESAEQQDQLFYTSDKSNKHLELDQWQPHLDIAQAMEVLEAFDYYYEVRMFEGGYMIALDKRYYFTCKLPEAICQSVLRATTGGRR